MLNNSFFVSTLRWFLFLPFLCFSQPLYANNFNNSTPFSQQVNKKEGTLSGYLRFADGVPVQDALIFIKSINKHAVSDDKGRYVIKGIPYGDYIVETQTIEAEPRQVNVVINQKEISLSITLDEDDNHQLSEVLIVGSSQGQQMRNKGFAVNVVDTKKAVLESIQASELLDRTSGVKIRQSGGLGSSVQYNLNGLSGNSVRMFIDGVPVRNYGPSFSLSSIPPAQIERIEVYKGVVPPHLAEDALGGAINVITKQGNSNKSSLYTSYSGGSFNTHQWNMDGSHRNSKSGFTVRVSSFFNYTDNNYKVWGDHVKVTNESYHQEHIVATRFHDSYKSYGVNASVGFTRVKWADELMINLLYTDMAKDVQTGGSMTYVYGNLRTGQSTKGLNLRYNKRNIIKGLSFKTALTITDNNRWIVDTVPYQYDWRGERIWSIFTNDFSRHNRGAEQGEPSLAKNYEKTVSLRSGLSYAINQRNHINVEYLINFFNRKVDDILRPQAERDFFDTRSVTKQIMSASYDSRFLNDKMKTSIFFKNYQYSVKLIEPEKKMGGPPDYKLYVVPLHYEKSISSQGYGITTSYDITDQFGLQASFEKAYRMPGITELLGNTSQGVMPTYKLRPEKGLNINIGVNVRELEFGAHQLRGELNLFSRDISDMIVRGVESLNTGMYSYENLGKVISKGFDSEIGYSFREKLYATFNVSLFNARFNLQFDEHGQEIVYYKDRLRNAPYFTMNTNIAYDWKDFLQKGSLMAINYNLSYVHEFFWKWESIGGAGKATIPTQCVHDLGLVYSFPNKKLSISFNAKNILNAQVFDNYALQKPGRAFYAKIGYQIF